MKNVSSDLLLVPLLICWIAVKAASWFRLTRWSSFEKSISNRAFCIFLIFCNFLACTTKTFKVVKTCLFSNFVVLKAHFYISDINKDCFLELVFKILTYLLIVSLVFMLWYIPAKAKTPCNLLFFYCTTSFSLANPSLVLIAWTVSATFLNLSITSTFSLSYLNWLLLWAKKTFATTRASIFMFISRIFLLLTQLPMVLRDFSWITLFFLLSTAYS